MPLVSIAKLSTPGNGGSRRRELSHLQVPDAGRGPADRTGGVSHQRRQTVGFAALPHDIAADPRLSPTDLRVLAAFSTTPGRIPVVTPAMLRSRLGFIGTLEPSGDV